jgi:hypothetical protein
MMTLPVSMCFLGSAFEHISAKVPLTTATAGTSRKDN